LLQASASIISMSKASDHVLEILDDMQETLEDDTTDHRPKRTTISQKDGEKGRTYIMNYAHDMTRRSSSKLAINNCTY
jgi:ectoine hydroxylase-related dioxygenase (phytanoyl-CoA dioxygenase family)